MASPSKTILITGGTGLIGSHLAERLLSLGYKVRCLLRYPDKRRWLGDLPVEVAPGDITIPSTLPDAVRGVDAVVHAAALLNARSADDFVRFNVQGTKNLLDACVNASPSPARFVYCSSQAAAGPSPLDRPMTVDDPANPLTEYGKSKLESERLIAGFRNAIETVIIRPSAVFGPRDRQVLLYFKAIATWRIKPFFGSPANRVSVIYVADLVEALICALVAPADHLPAYPVFVADPQPHTWAHIAETMEKALGRRALPLVIPRRVIAAAATISELFSGRKVSVFNREKAREMLASSWWCDPKPAIDHLGWKTVTPLKTAIQQTVDWYRSQGWIKT